VEQQQVHLDETKAQAFLGTTSSADDRLEGWYLDTSSTNHMTGRDEVFSELDRAVQGTIKFGDGAIINIYSKGTVIFSGHRSEHKVLTGVYWILWLRNSIISIRQMDESGSRVPIEGGVLKIWDRQRHLLARVQRTKNQMTDWCCRWQGHSVSWYIRMMTLGGGTSDSATPTSARWRG
jgi:hypothetical protein